MTPRTAMIAGFAALLASAPAYAISDRAYELAAQMIPNAKAALWSGAAKLENGKPIQFPPEGNYDIGNIPDDEAAQIIDYGLTSGQAEACGVEAWRAQYKAMLDAQRAKGRNEYQLAYVGILHGYSQWQAKKDTQADPRSCGSRNKIDLEKQIDWNMKELGQ